MIVLLNCSINLLANECDNIPSTGERDSVVIAYDDLRIVNSKLIELNYEREINKKYKQSLRNDSIIIKSYNDSIICVNRNNQKLTKQRNTCFIISAITIFIALISIIK